MFKLDNNFLSSLGLGSLPVDEKNKLLQAIYERLEMNVGMRLAEKMTDSQLDEFEGFIDRNDEAGALRWLETNFPNYKQVVAEELEKLKSEIAQAAPQILAAAQQSGQIQQQTTNESGMPDQSYENIQQTSINSQQAPAMYPNENSYQQPVSQSDFSALQPNQYQQPSAPNPTQQPPAQGLQGGQGSDNLNQPSVWPDQQPPPGPGV